MDLLPSMEQTYKHVCNPGLRMEEGSRKISFHVSEVARPYVLQIHDKFRNANISLVELLAEANWQRFMRVRQYMAGEIRGNDLEDPLVGTLSTFIPASNFHDSSLGSLSFVSSLSEKEGSVARVPATPKEVAKGISFQCFICRRVLTKIRNRIDWK